MRTFRRRILSSLVTHLTLAVLALLVLSLGLTVAVFVYQSRLNNRTTVLLTLGQDAFTMQRRVFRSLLNPVTGQPLARVGSLPPGVDRVLLTSWPDDDVVGDTAAGGAAPARRFPFGVTYHSKPQVSGEQTIDGADYFYVALAPLWDLPASSSSYHNMILLKEATPVPSLVWDVVRRLAVAGAVAIALTLLAAFVLLRRMTRPLLVMTRASERIAAGDYDQRVPAGASSDEIGQLARSFNRMAYEVKHARELQRQFVANVSHDLRSPLTSIIGFSQALTEDDGATPWQRRTAGIISGEAQRLHRLTMDLLDLSRLEAGRLPLAAVPLDLRSLLGDIAARYHALPNKRGVRFVDHLGDESLPVQGDPDRLTQVVVNLLDNALKFADHGGEVRLSAGRQGDDVVVEVYNTGAGIPPEDLSRVFDRFYRGDHSRAQQTGGSGIGLAIVRELARAHGGEVTATSAQGSWAALTLRLPLAQHDSFTKDLHGANTGTTEMVV